MLGGLRRTMGKTGKVLQPTASRLSRLNGPPFLDSSLPGVALKLPMSDMWKN